ncbi:ABC transporter substrate-binding protein [Konateibacter massiliensis]|uniref:ABC transporter substrate-binding protein n=1 Tax=Konateibacter massiliensis TaxID=2002841 RepID=UPI000C1542F4|nr:sugar ABC transporter substrate-binding protein [Konateibacter massiliensis]
MKKTLKKVLALALAGSMVLSLAACGGSSKEAATGETTTDTTETTTTDTAKTDTDTAADTGDKVTIKIAWWGSQTRHELTQKVLDLYTESHPNITFETSPSGWDGYFDKLSTQTASGSMPDIVQMDYLYLSTYAKNGSVADLQEFIDDGTIDVSNIDANLLSTGNVNDKMAALVLSTSMLSIGYNPAVFAEAGVTEPTSDWTWSDFLDINKQIYDKTGKYGISIDSVADTNLFNYWVRQNGATLFSEDNKSLGYTDDKIFEDFVNMWSGLMDAKAMPNPDEYAQISTLGQEAGPVVTGDAAMILEWNNYASKVSTVNENIKMVTPPLSDSSQNLGLWSKPGMFFSVAETSQVKKEAAEFINWFINSEEANDVLSAERGTPVSSVIRQHMVDGGNLTQQQTDMFNSIDAATALCGETPAPDPVGMSEVNGAFTNAANSVYYGQTSAADAAASFREEANAILARNN